MSENERREAADNWNSVMVGCVWEKQEGNSAAGRRLVTVGKKIQRVQLPEQGRNKTREGRDEWQGHANWE